MESGLELQAELKDEAGYRVCTIEVYIRKKARAEVMDVYGIPLLTKLASSNECSNILLQYVHTAYGQVFCKISDFYIGACALLLSSLINDCRFSKRAGVASF